MAVLVNAALLAILFMTAVSPDPDILEVKEELAFVPTPPPVREEPSFALKDEIDHLLVENEVLPPPPEPSLEPLKRFSDYIEVTVKRGDVLERIARAHKTSVTTLKKINNLKSERIDVGQILKVPSQETPITKPSIVSEGNREYYVVQEGDNPWKIAKQFHVGFEELLDLNSLDEVKARNLKVGDQIRVH
jgi:LysM repeat protein